MAEQELKACADGLCERHGCKIYSGPPACPACGAPMCCKFCCYEAALEARLSAAEAEVERLRAEVDAMCLAMLRIRREAATIDDAMTIIDPFDLTAAARRQQGGTDAR